MGLKIIKIDPAKGRIVLIAAALVCIAAAWFMIKWNFANAVAARLDTARPESLPIADMLTGFVPGDPQAHFAAAILFAKTFSQADLARSVKEYELAAATAPNNYLVWLELGKARGRTGDDAGADAAFRRAVSLAPNYASVQWAYGNFLVRQDRVDEGFALIAKAAAADTQYSVPAAQSAYQIFEGDLARVRMSLGDKDVTNAALARVLAKQNRFDESVDAWARLGEKSGQHKQLGSDLISMMAAAKQMRIAAHIAGDIQADGLDKPATGHITNGGFEEGLKARDFGLFEWHIAEGAEPQIGLSDGQKRTGKYGLWLIFNSFQTAAFRPVWQTVPVEPGASYVFEAYYRSDVKTNASLKWEIADPLMGAIAATPAATPSAEWAPLSVRFTVPVTTDQVIIRFTREGCSGPSCPTTGRLSFDDISLRAL